MKNNIKLADLGIAICITLLLVSALTAVTGCKTTVRELPTGETITTTEPDTDAIVRMADAALANAVTALQIAENAYNIWTLMQAKDATLDAAEYAERAAQDEADIARLRELVRMAAKARAALE